MTTANMKLDADYTFVYNWQIGQLIGTTKGTWTLNEKNKLILNSETQPQNKPQKEKDRYIIEKKVDNSVHKITINVKDENGNPLPYVDCAVVFNRGLLSDTTDFNGNVTFNVNSVSFIHVRFGFEQITYKNKDKSYNNFTFVLKQVNKTYLYFTNERLDINNGLLSHFCLWRKDKWENNIYKKTKM